MHNKCLAISNTFTDLQNCLFTLVMRMHYNNDDGKKNHSNYVTCNKICSFIGMLRAALY